MKWDVRIGAANQVQIERRLSGHGGQVGSNTHPAVRSKGDLSGQPIQRDRTALLHGLGIDLVYSVLSADIDKAVWTNGNRCRLSGDGHIPCGSRSLEIDSVKSLGILAQHKGALAVRTRRYRDRIRPHIQCRRVREHGVSGRVDHLHATADDNESSGVASDRERNRDADGRESLR